ncbi:hypothetical protein, partial [Phycicoccus flavus]
ALVGLPVPSIALFVAFRLARPESFWARRFYRDKPKKLARARARAARLDGLRRRVRDAVSFGGFGPAG